MVVHALNPSSWEAETGGVRDEPDLHSEFQASWATNSQITKEGSQWMA